MKRTSALFGASLAAGVTAAAGLIATSTGSEAATGDRAYGVSWSTVTSAGAWRTGSVADSDGIFTASASAASGVSRVLFAMPALSVSGITVTTSCAAGKPRVVISGGGAAGVYNGPTTVSAARFTGNANAVGSVSILGGGSPTVGANYELVTAGLGNYIQLGGVSCAAAPVTSPPTSTGPTSISTSPVSTPAPSSTSPTSPSSTGGPTTGGPSTGGPTTGGPTTGGPTTGTGPVSSSPGMSTSTPGPTDSTVPTGPTGSSGPTAGGSPTGGSTSSSVPSVATSGPSAPDGSVMTPTTTEPPLPTPAATTHLPVTG